MYSKHNMYDQIGSQLQMIFKHFNAALILMLLTLLAMLYMWT